MRGDNLAGDRKTQTAIAAVALAGGVHLVEALEDPLDLSGRMYEPVLCTRIATRRPAFSAEIVTLPPRGV